MISKSESIANLAKALCAFQSNIKNPPKNANNPFFKSKYTTLDDLIDSIKINQEKCGISYMQIPSSKGDFVSISTIVFHSSGEWMEFEPIEIKPEKNNAQGIGSAITYGRRYALASIFGIASDEDDDGNGAVSKNQTIKTIIPDTTSKGEIISDVQRKRLFAISKGNNELCKKIIKKYGYESTKEIRTSDYEKICTEINEQDLYIEKEV